MQNAALARGVDAAARHHHDEQQGPQPAREQPAQRLERERGGGDGAGGPERAARAATVEAALAVRGEDARPAPHISSSVQPKPPPPMKSPESTHAIAESEPPKHAGGLAGRRRSRIRAALRDDRGRSSRPARPGGARHQQRRPPDAAAARDHLARGAAGDGGVGVPPGPAEGRSRRGGRPRRSSAKTVALPTRWHVKLTTTSTGESPRRIARRRRAACHRQCARRSRGSRSKSNCAAFTSCTVVVMLTPRLRHATAEPNLSDSRRNAPFASRRARRDPSRSNSEVCARQTARRATRRDRRARARDAAATLAASTRSRVHRGRSQPIAVRR